MELTCWLPACKIYSRFEEMSRNRGLKLKLARVRQGLHLYEVARQAGISASRLSQFEGGHRNLPPELEDRLRAVLGLRSELGKGDA